MNKLYLISGVALIAGLSAPAFAGTKMMSEDWYASASAGWDYMHGTDFSGGGAKGEFDNTTNFSGAVGKRLSDNVRTEFELSYKNADVDKAGFGGDMSTWSLMANGYYDFSDSGVRPYIMAGLGAVDHVADITQGGTQLADDNDWVFGYQAGAGLNFGLSDKAELFTGYRYQGSVDADPGPVDIDYNSHEILGGLRYYFGKY